MDAPLDPATIAADLGTALLPRTISCHPTVGSTMDVARDLLRSLDGSQLPLLIRGVYYDQFEPAEQPTDCNTTEEFAAEVAEWLSDIRPVDPDLAVAAVFGVLSRHLSEGQIAKVRNALPKGLRSSWESIEARQTSAAEPFRA